MSTNERTNIRTIVKWSKSAAILATAAVLLVAYLFVDRVYAQPMQQVNHSLVQSREETSKTKTQLKQTETKLNTEVQVRDEKIIQLEKENAELKG